jgi:hypothetical protein
MPTEFFPADLRDLENHEKEYDFISQLGDLYVNLLRCSRSAAGTYQADAARSLQGLIDAIALKPTTSAIKAVSFAARRVCWQEAPRSERDQHLDRIARAAITYMIEAAGYNEQGFLTKRRDALVHEIEAFNDYREERERANLSVSGSPVSSGRPKRGANDAE